MDNMEIYEKVRQCPQNALKPIQAGRLKGRSDINPMWRIKALTELFGACGIGWYYEINRQWQDVGANGEITAFCNISLYIKVNDEWSKPIQGTGGSMFIAKEKNGLYTSDECYKMALTDAISVACKALGVAADVYWNTDNTKYNRPAQQTQPINYITSEQAAKLNKLMVQYNDSQPPEKKINLTAMLKKHKVESVSRLTFDMANEWIKKFEGLVNG